MLAIKLIFVSNKSLYYWWEFSIFKLLLWNRIKFEIHVCLNVIKFTAPASNRHRYTDSSFGSIWINIWDTGVCVYMCLHRLLSVWNGQRCYDCFGTNWKQQTTCNNLGEISIIMHNNHFMRLWIFLHIHMCRSPVQSILILHIHGVYFILMQPSLSPFGGIILCNNDVRMYRST